MTDLVKWLCERYHIPVDREHIIGKNQVPGVRTDAFPKGGPQYWGGASNKSSPGPMWNWTAFMERLGRKPVGRSLTAVTNCPVTTLPQPNAPLIRVAKAGERLRAYDSNNSYWLVLLTDPGVPQPYLPAGHYHWDGWVHKRFVSD